MKIILLQETNFMEGKKKYGMVMSEFIRNKWKKEKQKKNKTWENDSSNSTTTKSLQQIKYQL